MFNEATETLKSLELDFKTTQDKLKSTTLLLNTSRTNQQMQNDRYEHLDKEFNRIDLELNDSKAECKQLQIKIADYETNSTKLTEDLSAAESNLIAVKEELLQKKTEVNDLETDHKEISQCLENKNIQFEEVKNDLQYHKHQIEKLEHKIKETEQVKQVEDIVTKKPKKKVSTRKSRKLSTDISADVETDIDCKPPKSNLTKKKNPLKGLTDIKGYRSPFNLRNRTERSAIGNSRVKTDFAGRRIK